MSAQATRDWGRLAIVSPYRPWGASYRVRVQAWLDRTDVASQAVTPGRAPREQDSRRFAPGDLAYETSLRARPLQRFSRLLIQKEASRVGSGALEASLIRRSGMVLYDLDDAVFLPPSSSGGSRLGSREMRARTLLEGADRVIAGNAYLADTASRYCSDVRLIPTCVDLRDYQPSGVSESRSEGRLVVGWLGSASTEAYLEPLWPALAELQRLYEIEVRVIGSGVARVVERDGCRVVYRPWSLATQAAELSGLDIGLAPLPDTPWARGKCGYKLLQYGAAGVVPVGSPVGVAEQILSGAGAAAPSTTLQWREALEWLIADPSARERIADMARAAVAAQYTFDHWEEAWRDAVAG